MIEKTIKLYSFNELSKKVQAKIIKDYRNNKGTYYCIFGRGGKTRLPVGNGI